MQVHNTDVVIVGGGAASCYAGLNAHELIARVGANLRHALLSEATWQGADLRELIRNHST